MESRAERIANVTYTAPTETGEVETKLDESTARQRGSAAGAARGPQRPLPLRQRQEVQALPRPAGLIMGRLRGRGRIDPRHREP